MTTLLRAMLSAVLMALAVPAAPAKAQTQVPLRGGVIRTGPDDRAALWIDGRRFRLPEEAAAVPGQPEAGAVVLEFDSAGRFAFALGPADPRNGGSQGWCLGTGGDWRGLPSQPPRTFDCPAARAIILRDPDAYRPDPDAQRLCEHGYSALPPDLARLVARRAGGPRADFMTARVFLDHYPDGTLYLAAPFAGRILARDTLWLSCSIRLRGVGIDFCRGCGGVRGARVVVPLSFKGFPGAAAAAALVLLDASLAVVLADYAPPGPPPGEPQAEASTTGTNPP